MSVRRGQFHLRVATPGKGHRPSGTSGDGDQKAWKRGQHFHVRAIGRSRSLNRSPKSPETFRWQVPAIHRRNRLKVADPARAGRGVRLALVKQISRQVRAGGGRSTVEFTLMIASKVTSISNLCKCCAPAGVRMGTLSSEPLNAAALSPPCGICSPIVRGG